MPLFDLPLPIAQAAQGPGAPELIDVVARTPLSQVLLAVAALTIVRLALAPYLFSTRPHLRGPLFSFVRIANEFLDAIIYAGIFVFMIIRPFLVQAFVIPSGSMWPTLYVNDFIAANKAIYRYTDPKRGDIVVFRPPVAAIPPSSAATQIDENGNVKVDFIKRLIGVPGDVVELRKGQLYRNGARVEEPYKRYSDTTDNVNYAEIPAQQAQPLPASFKLVRLGGRVIPLNYTEFDANSAMPQRANFADREPYQVAPVFAIADPKAQAYAKSLPPAPIPPGYYLMMGDNRNNSFDSRGWGLVPRASIIGRSEFVWLPFSRIGRTR